jgi:hypothetical protein
MFGSRQSSRAKSRNPAWAEGRAFTAREHRWHALRRYERHKRRSSLDSCRSDMEKAGLPRPLRPCLSWRFPSSASGQHAQDHGAYEGERSTNHDSIDWPCQSHWCSLLCGPGLILGRFNVRTSAFVAAAQHAVKKRRRERPQPPEFLPLSPGRLEADKISSSAVRSPRRGFAPASSPPKAPVGRRRSAPRPGCQAACRRHRRDPAR